MALWSSSSREHSESTAATRSEALLHDETMRHDETISDHDEDVGPAAAVTVALAYSGRKRLGLHMVMQLAKT